MDHQRCRTANRPGEIAAVDFVSGGGISLQHAFNALRIVLNNAFEQKVIFDLRSDFIRTFNSCRPLVRQSRHRRSDDTRDEDVNLSGARLTRIEQGVVAVLQVVVMAVMFYLNATLGRVALAPFPLLIAGALLTR
jgi:ATP-binding cassette subfamily B protein/subfamily B ATP-binding cassette protein MsbA